MATQVDTAGSVYAVIGGGIAGVSCAEEVSPYTMHRKLYESIRELHDMNVSMHAAV